MLTNKFNDGVFCSFQEGELHPFTNTDDLLNHLRENDSVSYININSTLGRNFEPFTGRLPVDHKMISGERRGKALVLYTTEDREGGERERELAKNVFNQQLGLEVQKLRHMKLVTNHICSFIS